MTRAGGIRFASGGTAPLVRINEVFMKSTVAILLAGALALVASSYIPVLNGWGPMFLLWTAVAFFVGSLVSPESRDTRCDVSHKKAA